MKTKFGKYAAVALLVGSLFGGGGNASAVVNDWKLINTDGATKMFIDLNSLRAIVDAPSQVQFWSKETGLSIKVQKKIVRSRVVLNQIDCDQNTISTGPVTAYDKTGKVVGSVSTWSDWEAIIPTRLVKE
jgi:hypothetical protein